MILGEHIFSNGRKYKVSETNVPYKGGEYPIGGFLIHVWHKDHWSYIDNSPDEIAVKQFLKSAERLSEEQYTQ